MTGRGHNGNILNLQVNHWTIKHICVLYVIADPYKTIYIIIYTAGVQILFSSQAFGEHWYTEYVDRYHHYWCWMLTVAAPGGNWVSEVWSRVRVESVEVLRSGAVVESQQQQQQRRRADHHFDIHNGMQNTTFILQQQH